jgi:hypothetical protein
MFITRIQLLALAVVPAVASIPARAQVEDDEGDPADQGARAETPIIETIYNFRTVRVARTAPAEFCQGMEWPVLYEDTFDAYSYNTRAVDGRVVETERRKVGTMRACLGVQTLSPFVLNFFAEFVIGDLRILGTGVCTRLFANFPVAGAAFYNCSQSLSSQGYAGGQLATSTATGPAPIEDSDPNLLGVHETSFATIRLWRLQQ